MFLALTGHAAEELTHDEMEDEQMTLAMTLNDGWTVTRRNLFGMSRNPEVVIWSTIQPIMFIVLFVYVFSSIPTPGIDYVDYVMAGIFVPDGDVQLGAHRRRAGDGHPEGTHRPLPIPTDGTIGGARRSHDRRHRQRACPARRDGHRRADRRLAHARRRLVGSAGLLLVLAIGYVFSWISAAVGLSVKSVEVANSAGFVWMFPLTFVSNTFVDSNSLPNGWRQVAEWNPMSAFVHAVRELFGNTSD